MNLPRATFRFYAELNDFLPPSRRGVPFVYAFFGRPAVKDTIEALGVPHTEVDLVLLDGESVDFRVPLFDGAHVSVFPVFESIDIRSITRVHGYWIRQSSPRLQVVEVLRRFDLLGSIAPFERCLCCNEPLVDAEQAEIEARLPPRVRERHIEFRTCPSCGRIYWKGSHHTRMRQMITDLCHQVAAEGNFA